MATLTEIAKAINEYLVRFEADPVLNAPHPKYKVRNYYNARARQAGPYVCVTYISYQGDQCLNKARAIRYLEWLEAGNVGRHWEAERP